MSHAELIQVAVEGSHPTISFSSDHLNRFDTARQIASRLADLLGDDSHWHPGAQMRLRFGHIDRIGSVGLNELIGINSRARNRGVRLVLLDVQEAVRDVFALTRLERMFEFDSTAGNG